MLIIFYISFSVISLVMLYFINKKLKNSRNTGKAILKYQGIAGLNGDELAHAKASLLEVGIDGNASEDVYLKEVRIYKAIAIFLIISAVLLGLYLLLFENTRSTGLILIAVSLALISSKFYELYRIAKINLYLSS